MNLFASSSCSTIMPQELSGALKAAVQVAGQSKSTLIGGIKRSVTTAFSATTFGLSYMRDGLASNFRKAVDLTDAALNGVITKVDLELTDDDLPQFSGSSFAADSLTKTDSQTSTRLPEEDGSEEFFDALDEPWQAEVKSEAKMTASHADQKPSKRNFVAENKVTLGRSTAKKSRVHTNHAQKSRQDYTAGEWEKHIYNTGQYFRTGNNIKV